MRERQSRSRETVGDRAPFAGLGSARARRPRKAVPQCREARQGPFFSEGSRSVRPGTTAPSTPTFGTSRAECPNPREIFANV